MAPRKKSNVRKKAPALGQPASPTAKELIGGNGDSSDPDDRCVVAHFLGLTQGEARVAMEVEGIALADDFAYMADAGLRYYLPAAFDYLQSEQSKNNFEFCLYLLCSLRIVIRRNNPAPAQDVAALIHEIARYCSSCPEKFDSNPGAAWSFADMIDDILRR
jgi:hypothetical protein